MKIEKNETPPPPAHTSYPWAEVAAAARKEPGEWLTLSDFNSACERVYANRIKRGKPAPFHPPGSFEAVARVTNGEGKLYIRYVGD